MEYRRLLFPLSRFLAAARSLTTTPFFWPPPLLHLAFPPAFGAPAPPRRVTPPAPPPRPPGPARLIRARLLLSTFTLCLPGKPTPANVLPLPPSALLGAFGVGVAATTELSLRRWSDFPFAGTGPFTVPVPIMLVGTGLVIVPQVRQLKAGG